ncbi:hypothetical protein [Xanthomonas oryzae]|uniref:hypothetical protein n=1 Tax=Xanthomonas oryzae TaxID=347 RepID=UPI003AAC4EA4
MTLGWYDFHIFFLAIYASMCLNLVHSCFNLIFIVPYQVINWVGGHASATVGRDDNDRMRNALNVFSNKATLYIWMKI